MDVDIAREAKQRLAAQDQRFTRGRAQLLDIFLDADGPLSVQEVLGATSKRVPQSSVYRNVAVLYDAGILRRLNFDEGFVRYELAQHITEHHHHLVCSNCASVIDLDEEMLAAVESALAEAERAITDSHRFEIQDHHLELRGVCEACR